MDVVITLGAPSVTAAAAQGQTVTDADRNGSESVTLNGTGSTGTITSYVWYDGASLLATGVSPTVNLAVGEHWITLMVTGSAGSTAVDTAVITVDPGPPPNQAPTAEAGLKQTVTDTDGNGAEAVTLDGSGSTDPDGTITSYSWHGEVEIAVGKNPVVNFGVGGPYTITLEVTDNEGVTATDTVVITVKPGTGGNQVPTADAGPDQTVTDTHDRNGAEAVTLDGSGSTDPDGTITSYVWTEDATEIATGVSPVVSLAVGTHPLTLTVTDNGGATASDTVLITVTAPASGL